MALSVTHPYVSAVADSGDTSVVQPSDWNAAHTLAGLGTGVETALGINVGSAGAPVVLDGALGTPSSGTLTNCTFPTPLVFGTNTIELRNSTNAQTLRVYNTYTDASNYERGALKWNSNRLEIGTEAAGTGTARNIRFLFAATAEFSSGGPVIGTTAVTLPASGYFGISTRFYTQSPSDGVLTLYNWAGSDFARLQFGGTSSSFPSLKRSSAKLLARLADDSAYAIIEGKLATDTAYAAGDPATTGYLVLYDSTGTAYKVPALAV